jgi:hypothetical protein
MGSFAEDCAQKYGFTREAQDAFAIASLKRAQQANTAGWFAWETTPLAIKAGKDEKFVEMDEQPFKANLDKIPTLRPAFRKDGTVTAANSSSDHSGFSRNKAPTRAAVASCCVAWANSLISRIRAAVPASVIAWYAYFPIQPLSYAAVAAIGRNSSRSLAGASRSVVMIAAIKR